MGEHRPSFGQRPAPLREFSLHPDCRCRTYLVQLDFFSLCPHAHSADGAYSFRFATVLPRRDDFNRPKGALGQRLARPRIDRYRHDVAADSRSLEPFAENAFRTISLALDVHRRRGLLVFSGRRDRTAPRLALVCSRSHSFVSAWVLPYEKHLVGPR